MRAKHVREDDRTAVDVARSRFGGFDLLASLAGMLAALGLTVLLAGIAGAAGSVGYQRGTDTDSLSNGGFIAGLVILLAAFFVGGWVAGRMARYDGALNGTLAALLFVILAAAVSGVGSWLDSKYDFFGNVRLPQWFSDTNTTEATVSAAIGILLVLLAAGLGGAVGSRYHRRADTLIASTRDDQVVDDAPATGVHSSRANDDVEATEDTTDDTTDSGTTRATRNRKGSMVRGEADVDVDSSEKTRRRTRS
ncbi:MAG TPA: TIGR04086 family membrane protein [Mycobacteriales bacterium]|nr:TIGR04086 family membrane protein [Mycobacteriales bacterium]